MGLPAPPKRGQRIQSAPLLWGKKDYIVIQIVIFKTLSQFLNLNSLFLYKADTNLINLIYTQQKKSKHHHYKNCPKIIGHNKAMTEVGVGLSRIAITMC